MKKKKLKNLGLNKRSISNLENYKGGTLPETVGAHTCYVAECNLDSMPPPSGTIQPLPVPGTFTCIYSIHVCPVPN